MKNTRFLIFLLIGSLSLSFPLTSILALEDFNLNSEGLLADADTEDTSNLQIEENHSHKHCLCFFKDIPRHLGGDIKNSFWGWGSLAFVLSVGLAEGIHTQDSEIQSHLSKNKVFGKRANQVFDQLGAPYTVGGLSLMTFIIGKATHQTKVTLTGESLLEALFWSEIFTYGAKFAFHRNRPDGSKRGFPSAHASGAFSAATVLQSMYGFKAGVPAYLAASLVSFSRVDAFHHFPSDVIFGAALGIIVGYGTAKYHRKKNRSFSLFPDVRSDYYGAAVGGSF
jgi:hypothetical protein